MIFLRQVVKFFKERFYATHFLLAIDELKQVNEAIEEENKNQPCGATFNNHSTKTVLLLKSELFVLLILGFQLLCPR